MVIDKAAREVRRKEQSEGAARLIESGVMDDLFARIDAGEIELEGSDGLIQQLIKTGLERGLQAELTEHVGYEKGDSEGRFYESEVPQVFCCIFLGWKDVCHAKEDRFCSPRASGAVGA